MTLWACGIKGCGERFEAIEELVNHQATAHAPCECKVCGESLPAGFAAIEHAFTEHTRAEYVREYDADPDDIRVRERVIDRVGDELDVPSLLERLNHEGGSAVSVGD